MDLKALEILGGGAVAAVILFGVTKLITVLNVKRAGAGGVVPAECSMLSGEFARILNSQTELSRQQLTLIAKIEAAATDTHAIAKENASRLDGIGRNVAVILDRARIIQ